MSTPVIAHPFKWLAGTVQLFITCDARAFTGDARCWVSVSLPEYSVSRQVGTDWERRVAAKAVDLLNLAFDAGERRTDEEHVRSMVLRAQSETPFAGTC
jgi:hypothetical protein